MATPLRRNATFTLVLAFAVAPALRGAMPTLDQLLSLESVSRPTPSPDGRFVCYDVTETDWKENAYVSHLWLADTQTGRSFPLTRGRKSSDGAQWSPDGRWIAFLTERESSTVAPLEEKSEAKEEKKAGKKDGQEGRGQAGGAADLAHLADRRRGLAAHPPRREDRLVPVVPGRHAPRGRRARSGIESREGAEGTVQRIRSLRGRLQPEPPVARRRRGRREERTAGGAPPGRDGPGA